MGAGDFRWMTRWSCRGLRPLSGCRPKMAGIRQPDSLCARCFAFHIGHRGATGIVPLAIHRASIGITFRIRAILDRCRDQ